MRAEPVATAAQSAPRAAPAHPAWDGVVGPAAPRGGGVLARARRFRTAQDAVAAIEFGLILPVLLALMLGGMQLVTYVNATRKVDLIARSISQMISQALPPSGTSVALVTSADLHFSYDATVVLFPFLLEDAQRRGIAWWQDISINYASIQFTQTNSTCTDSTDMSGCYVANVVWTTSGTATWGMGSNFRPCILPQLPASNDAAPTPGTLPRSVYGPASIVVIDVVFTFTPIFGARFVPSQRIARTAYVQPRYASLVNFDMSTSDGMATKCPGY